jgi:hypothetical protein
VPIFKKVKSGDIDFKYQSVASILIVLFYTKQFSAAQQCGQGLLIKCKSDSFLVSETDGAAGVRWC